MSTTYLVTVELKTKGDLSEVMHGIAAEARGAQAAIERMRGSIDGSTAGAKRLNSELTSIAAGARAAAKDVTRFSTALSSAQGGKGGGGWGKAMSAAAEGALAVNNAFAGAVEKAGMVAVGAAAVGVGFLGHQLWNGVTHLNAELDNTRVSMAAIFNAQGMSSNMDQALTLASDQLVKMRADARALPGEFKDLANIMTSIAIPASQNGLSADKMREISALLMAGGVTAGVEPGQIAREAAQLLEGRAGSHNVLGLRLAGLSGDTAKKFNASSGADRVKTLEKELQKYAPALATFEKSWGGVSSTFVDNMSNMRRVASKPLFDNVLGTLSRVNDWFGENEAYVNSWAEHFGRRVSDAFDLGKVKAVEWYPHFVTFVSNAETRLVSMWGRIEPMAERAGSALMRALDNPATFDRIESLLKAYGVAKTVQIGAPIVGGIGRIVGPLLGAGGGGAAAAGVSGAGGGAASVVGAMSSLGPAAIVAAAGVATVGGMFWAVSQDAEKAAAMEQRWTKMGERWAPLATSVEGAAERVATAIKSQLVYELQVAADSVTTAAEGITGATMSVGSYFSELGANLTMFFRAHGRDDLMDRDKFADELWQRGAKGDQALGGFDPAKRGMSPMGLHALDTFADDAKAAKEAAAKASKGKKSGTTVQKVEIVVSSNQDPTRIARMVSAEVQNLHRHPKISRDVRDWSKP